MIKNNSKKISLFLILFLSAVLTITTIYSRNISNNLDGPTLSELTQSAQRGDPKSQYTLGKIYLDGQGVTANITESVKWFERAAKQGHTDSQYYMGLYYRSEEKYKEALSWLEKAALNNHAESNTYAGLLYLTGKGTAVDKKKAVSFFKKGSDLNSPASQYLYAKSMLEGWGGETLDLDTATTLLEKAVEAKIPAAYYELGRLQIINHTNKENLIKAGTLIKEAADLNIPEAQKYLTKSINHCAESNKYNPPQAESCLVAAGAKDINAIGAVGAFYHKGVFVAQNHEKAFKYLLLAAQNKRLNSQILLTQMYGSGTGTRRNNEEAYAWCKAALSNIDKASSEEKETTMSVFQTLENCEGILSRMTEKQREFAHKRAKTIELELE